MKNLMTFSILLAVLTSLSGSAGAAGTCTSAGVCAGDKTFAYYQSAVHAGTVTKVNADGSVSFIANGEAKAFDIKETNVAVTKAGKCSPSAASICIGKKSKRTDANGNEISGKITGYFTSGFILVTEGKDPQSFPAKSIDVDEADPEALKAAVKKAQTALEKAHGRDAKAPPCRSAGKGALAPLDQLEARIKSGDNPKLDEYLKLWRPGKADDPRPNPWLACRDAESYNHPVKKDAAGNLLSSCQPDTLYSWGPMVKIKELESKMGSKTWETRPFFNDALFLASTPAASFGYGSSDEKGGYAIRVKLKPGAKAKFITGSVNCKAFPEAEASNTVYIRIFMNDHGAGKKSSGEDFVICSSAVIHSWSYGTKESYDELSRDVSYIMDPKHKNEWFSYMRRPDASGTFEPSLWELGSDQHPFTRAQLANSFKNLLELSSQDHGAVFVNPDVEGSVAKNRADHFKTNNKIWFNPK